VRVKKTRKSARSIRYLLSANPKLQKISLKKLSARRKRPARRLRAARAKQEPMPALPEILPPVVHQATPAPRAPEVHVRRSTMPWGVALAVVAVTAAAVLVAVRETSNSSEPVKIDVRRDTAPPQAAEPTEFVVEKKPAPSSAPATLRNSELVATDAAAAPKPVVKAEPLVTAEPVTVSVKPAVKAEPTVKAEPAVRVVPVVDAPVRAQATDVPSKAAPPRAASVAITGCVARDEDTFWLKDTAGIDAPKSRSWKSGFLKKRSSNVELVDADHTLTLSSYVGQRVTATGTLADREMHARSLQRVASSCS
jgi:hypothetical protein